MPKIKQQLKPSWQPTYADRAPTWLELESVRPLRPDVEEITALSVDTIKRRYPHLIVQLSERRLGMQLKNALAIATGAATKTAKS
jgi:hypothetical protein